MPRSKQPIFLLVGVHRSGTSLLAQILSIMGLDVGRSLMLPSFDNPRGFWENEKIVDVHDRLLNALGRDWSTACFLSGNWASRKVSKQAIDQLVEVLETDYSQSRASLIKDPRLAALYPLWVEVAKRLGRPLKIIGVIRSVDQVTRSLMRRNRLELEDAEVIVLSYLDAVAGIFAKTKAQIVNYEALTAMPGEAIVPALAALLGAVETIDGPASEELVGRLVENTPPRPSVNSDMKALFDKHIGDKRFKLTPNRVAKFVAEVIDQSGFSKSQASLRKIKSFVQDGDTASVDVSDQIVALNSELFDTRETNKSLLSELDAKAQTVGALEGGISERDDKIRSLQEEAVIARERLGALEGGIAERDEAINAFRTDLTAQANKIKRLEIEKTEQESFLNGLRDEVDRKNTALNDLERGLIGHNQSIADLSEQLQAKRNVIESLELNLSDRDDFTERLLTEMERSGDSVLKQTGKINDLRRTLDSKDAEIGNQQRLFLQQTEELMKLEWQIKGHTEQVGRLEQEKSRLSEEAIELETRLEHERKRAEELEAETEARAAHIASLDGQLEHERKRAEDLQAETEARAAHIASLDGQLEHERKRAGDLEAETEARADHIQKLDQLLYEANEQKQNLTIRVDDLNQKHEALSTVNDLNEARSKMVEGQLSEKVDLLTNRLAYYQKHPVRAGLKRAVFTGLRFAKRALPLPHSVQMALSRRMLGLSQRLQPNHLTAPIDLLTEEAGTDDLHIDFEFPETDAPIISIIIPVYNEISQTISCLKSVFKQQVSVPYEVIIADDASPDAFHVALKDVKGARFFRNPENLGFLMNCNTNAEHARGEYIVFLNNDTLVHAGWLEALYRTYSEHDNVGIVGSKLVFPTGELQEAGGIIWEDASGWNWGRGQSADHPLYNFVRDVDYVSGASFMIKTDLFREIGGFYTKLEKAYYEDTDCCFRVRDKGYRVLYQPHSVVTHIEGLSSGTDVTSGMKKYQAVNQGIFRETWQHVLQDHLPNAQTPEIASDRKVKGHILYVDATTPTPDQDSGSLDAINAMAILIELGYRVHFIPGTNFAFMGERTKRLQAMGVECIYHPFYSNMTSFLQERGDAFDYIILSRAEINELFLTQVKKSCPRAKIIYNTVDLHFLRQQREAQLSSNEADHEAADMMRLRELSYMQASDATIILSEHERDVLADIDGLHGKLYTIPLIRQEATRLARYDTTRDIVFIGGYKHPPNVDAVEWLVRDIWPVIRQHSPDIKLHICGSAMPASFRDYAAEDILIKGFVPNLDDLLSSTRMTIAPLRYGAGLKGKVASSIGAGVPCIGTEIAFEGMAEAGLDFVKLTASTPQEFAQRIDEVYHDEDRWDAISKAGTEYHNQNYGKRAVTETYQRLLESLGGK